MKNIITRVIGLFSGGTSIYVYLIGAGLLVGSSVYLTHQYDTGQFAKEKVTALETAIQKRQEAEYKNAILSTELETERAKKKIVYRTITQQVDKIIDRPVYRNDCLDADGLRAINSALAGKAETTGQPNATVPAADAPFWCRWFGGSKKNDWDWRGIQ